MSQPIKYSEMWDRLEPFARKMINNLMLQGKSGAGALNDPYAIILYDADEQKLRKYSFSIVGLQAAIAASEAGDGIFYPPGTLTTGLDVWSVGTEMTSGSVQGNSSTGATISGMVIGNWYALETVSPNTVQLDVPYHPLWLSTRVEFDHNGSGWLGVVGASTASSGGGWLYFLSVLPAFASYGEPVNTAWYRIYFQAQATSIKIRLQDSVWNDNAGSILYKLSEATQGTTIINKAGVEMVGLGKNSIIDGGITNNGILTNIQVTGVIGGTGIRRMVATPSIEIFDRQVSMELERIINLGDPIDDLDAANKRYIDSHIASPGVDISSDDADILGVNFEEQASAPATPAAGHRIVYAKADGIYEKDDAGTETGPLTGATALADHDHSGDAGDGGTFGAANLTSGAAADGHVLTADGAGGAAWEAPPSGSGDVATDAIWDTKGDLAVGTGANTAARLPIGTDGKYLKAASGEAAGVMWDTPAGGGDVVGPASAVDGHLAVFDTTTGKLLKDGGAVPTGGYTQGARAYNNANLTIGNNSTTTLTLNSERYDTDTIHDTSTNTSRLTCKTAGKYLVTGTVDFAAHATGLRGLYIWLNGTTYIAIANQMAITTAAIPTRMTISTIYDLAVNDYVELRAYQSSGGDLNVQTGANFSPEFMMQRIG